MASFLTQNDVDELLAQVNNGTEITEEGTEQTHDVFHVAADKVIKHKEKPIRKYIPQYISPVIKRDDVIFASAPQQQIDPQKTKVYTLEQYQKAR